MKTKWLALPLALALGAAGMGPVRAYAASGIGQDRDHWDIPPRELSEIQRRGFHDGIEGARHDLENHRRPDVNNRDEYRTPNLPRGAWEEYRDGFRRGYNLAVDRLRDEHERQEGAPPPPPPPAWQGGDRDHDRAGWDVVPGRFSEIQRRGFRDGIEGARRDLENHRRSDPTNRDEYRRPMVPPEAVDEYREGFRRGYYQAIANLTGEVQSGPWDAAPGAFSEVQRRGFQEGMEEARRDVENHRRPDPTSHDEYRNPRVPPPLVEDYREGFRRGYERAISHLLG